MDKEEEKENQSSPAFKLEIIGMDLSNNWGNTLKELFLEELSKQLGIRIDDIQEFNIGGVQQRVLISSDVDRDKIIVLGAKQT